MKKLIAISCLLFSAAAYAQSPKLDARIEAAHRVLHELMATPDKGIPDNIASHATCVAVIPGFKKGAFVVGGEYGQGVVSCRTGHGWSAPAFVQLTGASFGFQIGGQSTDLVLISVTHNGFERLLHDKVKLGGDISVAAGPVGRDSQALHHGPGKRGLPDVLEEQGHLRGRRPEWRCCQPEPRCDG